MLSPAEKSGKIRVQMTASREFLMSRSRHDPDGTETDKKRPEWRPTSEAWLLVVLSPHRVEMREIPISERA
jgi:hypothetical protein